MGEVWPCSCKLFLAAINQLLDISNGEKDDKHGSDNRSKAEHCSGEYSSS